MSQKSRLSWRVNEIVIVSVIAAACAVIFWIWDIAVDPATKTLFAAVPEHGEGDLGANSLEESGDED